MVCVTNAPGPTGRKFFYEGTTAEEIQDASAYRIGMGHWAKQGIAGRGVLIDYPSYAETRGVKVDALSQHAVTLDEVIAIADDCSIKFRHSDILFLRIWLTRTWDVLTPEEICTYSSNAYPKHAGLEASEEIIRFMWNTHFAAVASDTPSFEVYPPLDKEWNMHETLLAGWGLPMGDLFYLEDLAELCKKMGRWAFVVSSSPMNCARGVSSPANIMAIL